MVRPIFTPPEDRLAETLKAQAKSVQDVQRPTGTEKNRTLEKLQRSVDYLASLRSYAVNGFPWNTGTIPPDAVIRWDDGPTVQLTNLDVPYGKMMVTASVGEASVAPSTPSAIQAFVSFWVLDANGDVTVDNRAYYAGRLYSLARLGLSISTGPRLVTISPSLNPGPYTVRMQFGYWASTTGATDASIQFNSPSLTVQIIGDGVPD